MIVVETYRGNAITEHPVEVVERKGTGHPDFICDSVMEAISIALSKEYMRTFGCILHHNIDKVSSPPARQSRPSAAAR